MTWRPDYVDPALFKSWLRISDTADDDFVALWITTASRNIDEHCGRQFGKPAAPVARTYESPVWDRDACLWVYTIDDLYDTTGVAWTDKSGNAVTVDHYEPRNAVADGKPYERVLLSTPLTGRGGPLTGLTDKWGWATQPPSISTGLLMMGARLAARRDSPFGVAGSPSDGSEIRLLAKLDPDMITVLKPFRRTWWAK